MLAKINIKINKVNVDTLILFTLNFYIFQVSVD